MDRLVGLGLAVSIGAMSAVRAASYDGFVRAPNINEHVEDVRVNIEDRGTVNLVTAFSITDPDGTIHNLKINGDLSLKATKWNAKPTPEITIELIRSKGGKPRTIAVNNQAYPAQTTAINFSVCGDRTILVFGGTNTGRCADLPPMAKADPQIGICKLPGVGAACLAPYEDMPAVITAQARIAPLAEPGERLTISGQVVGVDGRPRAGIIVYAYHTNRLGVYPPPSPPRSIASNGNGTLRGWARTDAQGHYVFETIRPGSYPNSFNPQHVHMHIIEPGCATYFLNELQFSDDPMRKHMSAQDLKSIEDLVIVETPRKTAKGWEVTRDIRLGENVKDYKPCSATK